MSNDIDPFADDTSAIESNPQAEAMNRFGMSSIRQALSRWWIILIFGILGYVAALYYMSIAPPKHEAVAVLEVDIKVHQLMGAELDQDRITPEIALATEASKLMGPGILAATAESPEVQALKEAIPPEFSWKPRYWRTEEELASKPADSVPVYDLVDSMVRNWITISGRRNTSLIEVRVTHSDSETARVLADTLLKVYLEKEHGEKSGGATEAYKILKGEADDALLSLENAERSLQVYVSALKLNEGILENRAELIAMRLRYKAKHPKMIQAEAIYQDMYDRFRREIKRATQTELEQDYWLEYLPTMTALDEQIQAADENAPKALDEWLALVQNALSSRANRLGARINHQQALYQSVTKRMTEIDVADESNTADLRVIEPAFIGKSLESVRLIYLAAGSVVGLMGGFGIAFLLGLIDYKIYDVRSIEEATGLTCLSAVPDSDVFGRSSEWKSIFTSDPHSANAEAIRNLRATIVLLGKRERHRTILITSSIPGEGKTTVAAELATAFALSGDRTLLIDFDLRRPRIHQLFPCVKDQLGVVDILAGQTEISKTIHKSELENLFVIGGGSKAPNPSELLHEDELVKILNHLTPHFDRIIIDSAPILPVSDSRILAKHVQSVISVVRARKAPVGAVIRTRDLIQDSGGTIVGVVLNGMKKSVGRYGYYGYKGYGEYGAEGGYGYYGEDK